MKSLWALALSGLMVAGCAKTPANGVGANTRIHITMTVAGQIKPNYVYIVAIRWAKSNPPFDQERGPIPVIASPWGNGFVAGRANVFMRWDSFQAQPYQMFRFTNPIPDDQVPQDEPYLTNWVQEADPINYVDVTDGGSTLDFELDLSQIAPSGEVASMKALQINFLTMDRVPTGGDSGGKYYDGLGDTRTPSGINKFLTIPLDRNYTYTRTDNPEFIEEPTGDVSDPDLDIKDWSVKVTLP
ncbi:MAG: hypothetical protein BGO01_15465 [Armatimonadetes bacterium 55-13]|nr:hypothetical protein [Armatimonadota bacterium]OJU65263.1 MAG: hypothetical protein BGO01_15465 [Armatimonadetes bacterium 55-13]